MDNNSRYEELYNYYNSFNNGGCRERQTLYDEYILKDISLTLAMILDEIKSANRGRGLNED